MGGQVAALRHVGFEDLGSFEPVLKQRGYSVDYYDAGISNPADPALANADILVVLGGPIGAYEEDRYPFLRAEIALIERFLAAAKPILGICLGAQLMARALGARVYPGAAKEIGFAPLTLTAEGLSSCLAPLAEDDGIVLHWHGDRFDLPAGAVRLASTDSTPNQAFALGRRVLGLQFHAEARQAGFERWLIGHACEIASLSPPDLRADSARFGASLEARGRRVIGAWLDGL